MARGFSQLYLSLGDLSPDGHASPCGVYHKPLVLLIWLGTIVMVIGGDAVADRPAAARRRAEAGEGQARDAAGGVGACAGCGSS